MALEVKQITEITDSLSEAFERLMPLLSPSLTAPAGAALQRIVASPTAALFAVCDGDRIAGVLTLVWYDVPSGRKAWIEDVVVDAVFRGCGAGEQLVRAAMQHAADIGAVKVMLTSSPARQAAHALYRKVGFIAAETTVFVFNTEKQ